jgi:hypothetical protein
MEFLEAKLKLLNQLPESSIYIHWNPETELYYVGIEGLEIRDLDGGYEGVARASAANVNEAFSGLWSMLTQPNKRLRYLELGANKSPQTFRYHDGRFQLMESI